MKGRLVTIGLKACNQRATIEAALKGALAQTYRPLEIIISDDGSTDGTIEVIGEKVNGEGVKDLGDEIRVVVNRNERNLGNMGNWLKICELAHGEWIVKCDGDDISEPTRVEKLMDAINAAEAPVFVASSGGVKIDAEGRSIRRFKSRSAWHPLGAVMAFHRRTYTDFPRPTDLTNVDDEIFARRALILGEGREVRVDEPLVRYRVGSGVSSSNDDIRATELKCMRMNPRSFAQIREDLKSIGSPETAKWEGIFAEQARLVEQGIVLRSAPKFSQRLKAWWRIPGKSLLRPYGIKLAIYLLPKRIGDWMLRVGVGKGRGMREERVKG